MDVVFGRLLKTFFFIFHSIEGFSALMRYINSRCTYLFYLLDRD